MAIQVERTKKEFILDDSELAAVNLSALKFCFVDLTGGATGGATVTTPTGQGAKVYGVLQNAPDAPGEICQIAVMGITEAIAASAITAGEEVTVNGATGTIETAASGDYVCGRAREAATQAGHCISIFLTNGYFHP